MDSLENADTDNQEHIKVQGYRDGNRGDIKDIGDLVEIPFDLESRFLALGIRRLSFTGGWDGWKGDVIYGVFSDKPGEVMKDEQFYCETLQLLKDHGIVIPFTDEAFDKKGIFLLERHELHNFRNWLMTHKDLIKYLPILREFGIYVINSTGGSISQAAHGVLYVHEDSNESFIRILALFAYLLKQRSFVQISTEDPPRDVQINHLKKIVQWMKRHDAKLRQRFKTIVIENWLGGVRNTRKITEDTLRIRLPSLSSYWDNLEELDKARDKSWDVIFSDKKYDSHIVGKKELLSKPQDWIERLLLSVSRTLSSVEGIKHFEGNYYASSRQYIANEVVRMLFKSGTCKAVAKDESASQFAVRRADGSYSGYMVEVDVIAPPFVVTFKEVKKDENGQWKTTVKFRKYFGEITEIYGKDGAK